MNLRNTTFLFGLLLSMLWLFGLMLAYKKTTFDSPEVMPSLKDAAIESLTIERSEPEGKTQTLNFVHTGDDWSLKMGDVSYRVDRSRLDKIVQEMKKAVKTDDEKVSTDSAVNGLNHPRLILTLKGKIDLSKEDRAELPSGKDKDKDKEKKPEKNLQPKEWWLKVGKPNAAKTVVYVSASDRPGRVFAVSQPSIESLFFADVNQLRPKQPFEIRELAVKKVLIKDSKDTLELKKSDDESWRFVAPPLGMADYEGPPPPSPPFGERPKPSTGGVKGLINSACDLSVDADSDFIPLQADLNLSNYGLDDGKETMRVQLGEDKSDETLLVGRSTGDKDEKFFARMQSDKGVFKLSAKQLKVILDDLHNPVQLRSKDVTLVEKQNVDKIAMKFGKEGKETIELTHAGRKPWEMRGPDSKTVKASEPAVEKLLVAIEGKGGIQSFLDPSTDQAKKIDSDKTLEVAVFASKPLKLEPPKFEPPDAKDEKKVERGPSKLAVTLTFGPVNKDKDSFVAVKRQEEGGAVTLFTIKKSLAEEINPPDPQLVYLDTALPSFDIGAVASVTLDRGGKGASEVVRGTGANAGRWVFKDSLGKPEVSFADAGAVNQMATALSRLIVVKKWLSKIDDKTDLKKLGLDPPATIATVIVKKTKPAAAAALIGQLGNGDMSSLSAAFMTLGDWEIKMDRPVDLELIGTEKFEIRIGKETDEEKDRPAYFARHSGNDVLFLVDPNVVEFFRKIELRDRSLVKSGDAMLVASTVAQGPWDVLVKAPLLVGNVVAIDPAKVTEVRLEIRTRELRKFHFVRKDKTWVDQSGLAEFKLDAQKVTELVEKVSKLHWDPKVAQLVTLVGGPRPDYKLDPKEAVMKLDITLESKQVVSLTVGDLFQNNDFFAQASTSPQTVFLLSKDWVEPILGGVGYFGKDLLGQ